MTGAQGLTGTLIGTVTDAQGGVLSDAVVRISSPALIGGELTTKTDQRGELRFPSVPPGWYALDIVLEGFRPYRDADIYIGAGATIERTPVLTLAAMSDSIVVHGPGSRRGLEAVTHALSCHAAARNLVKLLMDERYQSLAGGLVSLPPSEKERGDIRGVRGYPGILGAIPPGALTKRATPRSSSG